MDVYTESFEPTTRPSTVAWTKPNFHDSDSSLDIMDLTGIDPRALAPIESTFKIEFEGFDPNTEAKDDPIFKETRAKLTNLTISLNQINNFGRGDVFLSQVRLEYFKLMNCFLPQLLTKTFRQKWQENSLLTIVSSSLISLQRRVFKSMLVSDWLLILI